MLFSFQSGTCLNTFYAHDDFISSLVFHDTKLASISRDMTIKLWDLKQPVLNRLYEDTPIVLFDHTAPIISADFLRVSDDLKLASIDMSGQVLIRSLKYWNEQYIE